MRGVTAGIRCKMRGKKTMSMLCGCCVAQNFKWDVRVKEALKEIKEYSPDSSVGRAVS